MLHCKKVKFFPNSLRSVGPGVDPARYRQPTCVVTISHPPGGRLPLLSARLAVTFPAEERHRPYRPVPNYTAW